MKKTLVWLLAVASIILSLQMSVFAHSGRTDSRGGHYNRSTGEYHYHHGYSAHDHYDMDGDGDKDCPYKFNDKTDYDISDKGNDDTYDYSADTNHNSNASKKTPWYDYVAWVVAGAVLLFAVAVYLHDVFALIWKFVEWLIDKIGSMKGR